MTPLEKFRRMVGQSPTWQSLRGVSGEAAIQAVAVGNMTGDAPRPHAIVAPTGVAGYRRIAGGTQCWMRPYGTLELMLSVDHPGGVDSEVGRVEAYQTMMSIVNDVRMLSGAEDPGQDEGHLPLAEVAMVQLYDTPEENRRSNTLCWTAIVLASYGDGE